jgi:aminotransferase
MNEVNYRIARAVADLPPSGIRAFFDLVMAMDDVVSLGVGEPDFVTPWHIREMSVFALEKGYTSYTSNRGTPDLLKAVAASVNATYGIAYDPHSEVLVTVGVSEAIDLAMRALLEPDDEVIVVEPCYVSYVPTVRLAGGKAVIVETWDAPGFKLTPAALEAAITSRTRALLLNYPTNPTGASYTRDELVALAELIRANDLLIITDEVYDALSYDVPHTAFATLPGMRARTIYLNGFSKAYAMTGFRLGYACGPEPLIAAMTKIHQYTMLCAPIVSQMAGVEALRNGMPAVRDMVAEYDRRRRFFVQGLNDCGLTCHMPQGAFYAFPSCAQTGLDADEFATRLLKQERVAVVPGTAFGRRGTQHLRMAYAASLEDLERALERMARFIISL